MIKIVHNGKSFFKFISLESNSFRKLDYFCKFDYIVSIIDCFRKIMINLNKLKSVLLQLKSIINDLLDYDLNHVFLFGRLLNT